MKHLFHACKRVNQNRLVLIKSCNIYIYTICRIDAHGYQNGSPEKKITTDFGTYMH